MSHVLHIYVYRIIHLSCSCKIAIIINFLLRASLSLQRQKQRLMTTLHRIDGALTQIKRININLAWLHTTSINFLKSLWSTVQDAFAEFRYHLMLSEKARQQPVRRDNKVSTFSSVYNVTCSPSSLFDTYWNTLATTRLDRLDWEI